MMVVMFTCTQRSLHIHVAVYIINISIPVSDYCMLLAQAPVMFTLYNTNADGFLNLRKMRSPSLIVGRALLTARY